MRSTSPDSNSSVRIASSGMPCSSITATNDCRHPAQRRRQRLLHGQVEHRLLAGGQLDGALPEPADGLGHRQRALLRAGPVASRWTPTPVMNPTPSS